MIETNELREYQDFTEEFFITAKINVIDKYNEFISNATLENKDTVFQLDSTNFLNEVSESALRKFRLSLSHNLVVDNNCDRYVHDQAITFLREAAENTVMRYFKTFCQETLFFDGKPVGNAEREKVSAAQEACHNLFESIKPGVLGKYHNYVEKARPYIVRIQKYCRGRIFRLIHKMELMNMKLVLENKKLAEKMRQRKLSLMKAKSTKK